MSFKPIKWVKKHPWEAAAIAAGVAVGAPMLFAAPEVAALAGGEAALAGGGEAIAGGLAGGGAEASLFGAGVAAAPETAFGGAAFGSGALGGGSSALLAPFGEDFAAQMAGQSMAGGGSSALLGPYAAPSADPALLGGNTPLSSPYSGWFDKATAQFGDKLKDPKTVMRLGQMAMQAGGGQQQGGPMGGGYEQPAMRPALQSQADITKAWLMRNDPNTYRRIYGNPQGGVA